VVIVGGGGTGGAIAHDLSLRGLRVTLVERGEITSGSTGRHHGLLHSGARYVTTDRSSAIECSAENKILRRICPGSFEENDGLYVAISDDDVAFADRFLEACWQCAVPAKRINRDTALRMEPQLSPALRFAVQVPDATMDAMRMPLRFFATARRHGLEIKPFTEVTAVKMTGRTVNGVAVRDHSTGRDYEIGADVVINAAGAWAGKVAALAEVKVPLVLSPGVMVAIRGRHCNMAVSRLNSPGDGDALVPQRGLTLAGTSSWIATNPDDLGLPQGDVEMIVREGALMIPALATAKIRAVWVSARPLIGEPEPRPRRRARSAHAATSGAADPATDGREPTGQPSPGRELARGMRCLDHATDATPTQGFVTVAGGKATTLRAMAEVTADLVCAKLGLDCQCETADYVLLPHTAWYGA
jgi:glycerol-3-phosphate dehydrogenase